MVHKIDDEFISICQEIMRENKSLQDWAEIERDDLFQTEKYEGGFDTTELEFCFSVYIVDKEYWFQLSLDSIEKINNKIIVEIEVAEPTW